MSLIQHNRTQLTGFAGSFASVSNLPIIANNGQFAITLDTNTFYIRNGGIWIPATGGGGGSPTNLGIGINTATVLQITSSTGTPVNLPSANITTAGVLTATDWNTFNNKQSLVGVISPNNILLTNALGQAIDSGKAFTIDGTLSADSDALVPTEKAVKAYVDNKVPANNSITNAALAQAAARTWKGNNSGVTSNVSDNPAGDLTSNTTNVLTVVGGSKALLNNASVTMSQASATTDGYLSGIDWATFNNKQNALANPVTGQALSVDSEIALFSGATGQVIKRATGTGIVKTTNGVFGFGVSGTDYAPATTGTSILKGNGSGGFANAISGTDYQAPLTNPVTGTGTSGQLAQFNGVNSIVGVNENTAFNQDFETLSTNIQMDGTASVGILSTIPRADHVHPHDATKADKVLGAIAGNIATLDATGNLIDSGFSTSTLPISTPTQNALNLKQNLVATPTLNDILLTDATGQSIDSGVQISIDGSFSANSDSLIPTQKAVATYVANNSVSSGKAGVYAITLTNFASTYNNGALGVGATLTATANGVFTADGVAVPATEAVLVNSQLNSFENGIYIVTVAGTIGTPAVLTRRTDYDQSSEIKIGDTVFVENGNTQSGTLWYQTETVTTIGTNAISFSTVSVGSGFLEIANDLSELTPTASIARANISAAASGANTDITSVILSQNGLSIKDGVGTNHLTIKDNETLTANRTLNIITGDADRTLTLTGNTSITGTNTGDQTITLTGDVTGSGTGSFATTISPNAVTNTTIAAAAVTSAKVATNTITGGPAGNIGLATITSANIANSTITGAQVANNTIANSNLSQMPANTIKGNNTASTANALDLTTDQVRTMLFKRVTFSNANYTINPGESFIAQVGTLTASRNVTLPLANSVTPGFAITIADESGSVGPLGIRIFIVVSGGDSIVGTSNSLSYPYGSITLTSNGGTQWTADASATKRGNILYGFQPVAAVATANVANINIIGLATVDGYTVQNGDRILLVGQTNPVDNGIFLATTSPGNWGRDYDFAQGMQISKEQYVNVINGTVNGGTTWKVTQGGITVTDPIGFVKVVSAGTNLGSSATSAAVQVTSSTGIGTTLPNASASQAGVITAANFTTFNTKQSGLNITTVGPTGADFTTVTSAIASGARIIRIIGNTSEPSGTLNISGSGVTIVVANGVNWSLSGGNPGINMSSNNAVIYISTEGSGIIFYGAPVTGGVFISATGTNVNFYRSDFNLSLSGGGSNNVSVIGTLGGVYSDGKTEVSMNNLMNGFNYNSVTREVAENAIIILNLSMTATTGVFTYTGTTIPFYVRELRISGSYPSTTIVNCNGVIGDIFIRRTSPALTAFSIGGVLNGLQCFSGASVDLTVSAANVSIANANLNGGTININGQTAFTATNVRANTAVNKTVNSVFTGCFFTTTPTRSSSEDYKDVNVRSGSERATSIGALIEATNPLNLFINSHIGDDILNNGTESYPFATVSNAQLFAVNNSVINLSGTINESILFNAFDFQVLTGQNIAFEPLTIVNGQITITGASERIYISDLAINYDAASPIYIDSTNGAHGMNNLYITTTSAYAIEIDYSTSSSTQKVFISNTDFRTTSGIIMLTDIVGGGSGTLELDNCIGVNIHIGNGWNVIVNNSSIASQTRSARSGTITYLNLASATGTGYLSSQDWVTFNSKVSVSGGSTVVGDVAFFSNTTGSITDNGVSLSTDGSMAANSNNLIPTQAAVKTYSLNKLANNFITFPQKLSSDGSDVILIEDSANSGSKAYLTIDSVNVDGGTF